MVGWTLIVCRFFEYLQYCAQGGKVSMGGSVVLKSDQLEREVATLTSNGNRDCALHLFTLIYSFNKLPAHTQLLCVRVYVRVRRLNASSVHQTTITRVGHRRATATRLHTLKQGGGRRGRASFGGGGEVEAGGASRCAGARVARKL